MSLSKAILDGNIETVKTYLEQDAAVNVIDEYGYTPLIHATVTKRLDLVELLLKHHAQVNLVDQTGSTALHWAVDVNDLAITQLLLKYHANPNAYTANGQPVLFYPILRHNQKIVQALINKGADIHFVNDYINAKLVGHRFELQGSTDIINGENLYLSIDLEGFYLEFTLNAMQDSLTRFIRSYHARRMDIHEKELHVIIDSIKNAADLRKFKHFSTDIEASKQDILPFLNKPILLLPVSFKGHAITLIRYQNLLAICDRGVHKMTDPITVYHVRNHHLLTESFLVDLLYKRQTVKFIKHDIYQILGLSPIAKLPIKHQITGNCSWANVEASLPTMLFMLLQDSIKNNQQNEALIKEIMHFYQSWLEWDKDRALEDWMNGFEAMSLPRQKTKATLIGAVLFQACLPHRAHDVARAKKILAILSRKPFHYVVRIYTSIFVRRNDSSQGRAFKELVEKCGYQLSDFRV